MEFYSYPKEIKLAIAWAAPLARAAVVIAPRATPSAFFLFKHLKREILEHQ
jgi:hypothetical protein